MPYWSCERDVSDTDQPIILIAEDREDDILVITKAFEKTGSRIPLQFVRDGEEVVNYLAGTGKYSNRLEYPVPALLLLDLKMPRLDGFEVLRWIRQQPTLAQLRVVVLTSSNELRDVNKAYSLGAHSFLVKPTDFELTVGLASVLEHYWVGLNKPPSVSRPAKTPSEFRSKDNR